MKLDLSIFPAILDAVHQSEALLGPGNGAAKREAALKVVLDGVVIAEGVSGKDLVQNEAFQAGLGQIIDDVVKAANDYAALKASIL